MAKRRKTGRSPIGIDIGGRFINAVQLDGAGEHVLAVTSVKRPVWDQPLDAEEAGRLASVLERQGFHGRRVVVAMPSDRVMTAVLELPPANSGAPLEQISRAELAAAHKCDPGAIESAFWPLPDAAQRRQGSCVMAVGCQRQDAESILDAFEAVGLTVSGLDVQSWAVQRACAPLLAPVNGIAAILCIDWATTNLVVVSDGRVAYERVLSDTGMSRLHAAMLDELDLDADVADYIFSQVGIARPEDVDQAQRELLAAAGERILAYLEALLREVRMSLGYVTQEFGRAAVERLLLTGEGASVPGLAGHLSAEFGQKARVVGVGDVTESTCAGIADDRAPHLLTALGLARYPEGGDP